MSATFIRFVRSGEPSPVGKSQPGVAGSGLAPSMMSRNAVAPAELAATLYSVSFARPSGPPLWAALTRAHMPVQSGEERLVPPSEKCSL